MGVEQVRPDKRWPLDVGEPRERVVDDLPDDSRREVNADGFCRFPRIPWGTETLRVSTRTPFAAREVEITPSSWSGSEPFQLRVKD